MLLIHTALHAEARALIDHFGLKRQHQDKSFACFTGDDVYLIESGIGKIQTAASVGWLHGRISHETPIWLNIGMAGHRGRPLGSLVRVQRVEDEATGNHWYPTDLFEQSPDGENLITLDQASESYPEEAAIDMEASGFFGAASRFTTLELTQSLKIISDNAQNPPRRFKATEVEDWFQHNMPGIDSFIGELLQIRKSILNNSAGLKEVLMQRWRFSQYQQSTLHRQIQRYQALYPGQDILNDIPENLSQAKAVLDWIDKQLKQATIQY